MPSRRAAVASSPVTVLPQSAMSPAPTSTGSPDGGGGLPVTVTVELPRFPLFVSVAVMVAVPGATPITSAEVGDTAVTVANAGADDVHVNVALVTGRPPAPLALAVS